MRDRLERRRRTDTAADLRLYTETASIDRCREMPSASATTFRKMMYAALRVFLDGLSVKSTAAELECSPSYITRLLMQWTRQIDADKDGFLSSVVEGYKEIKQKRGEKIGSLKSSKEYSELKVPRSKGANCMLTMFGVLWTEKDEERTRNAVRGAIRYISKFGGSQAQYNSDEYTPIDRKDSDNNFPWLTRESAALYCCCDPEYIEAASLQGKIRSRVYLRSESKCHREYALPDLDAFIIEKGLL